MCLHTRVMEEEEVGGPVAEQFQATRQGTCMQDQSQEDQEFTQIITSGVFNKKNDW